MLESVSNTGPVNSVNLNRFGVGELGPVLQSGCLDVWSLTAGIGLISGYDFQM